MPGTPPQVMQPPVAPSSGGEPQCNSPYSGLKILSLLASPHQKGLHRALLIEGKLLHQLPAILLSMSVLGFFCHSFSTATVNLQLEKSLELSCELVPK